MAEDKSDPQAILRAITGGKAYVPPARGMSMKPSAAEATYPLNELLIPANDAKGHGTKIIVRIPPEMKTAISIIISSGKWPWKTESDFARTGIYKELEAVSLKGKDPQVTEIYSLLAGWVKIARIQQEYLVYKDSQDQIKRTLEDLISNKAWAAAEKIIEEIKGTVEGFEDNYWRERFKVEIIGAYEGMIERARKKAGEGGKS